MEAFPPGYIDHNLPLVFLSGLEDDSGNATAPTEAAWRGDGTPIRLSSEAGVGESVPTLLQQLLLFDGSDQPWNATSLPGPAGRMRFKMRPIGRTCAFPPRKAAPAARPTSPDSFQNNAGSPQRPGELHSPLSPLSPGSPVYPDGVLTPLWLAKHQKHVPALILIFFQFTSSNDGGQDEQIKADINAVRAALVRSGYKTKLAAVLISDRSILQDPGLEERISSVRRATGLDSKLGLFFMPPMSSKAEVATFVDTIMKALQPLCVEFYRDLTKHARRKKSRVGPNPSASADHGSQVLSTSGWNARYDIKQGVFAETRQEMDVAERHFTAAIDELFSDEGILESMPSWSPRWDEARLLSDCIALRVVRCHLWNSATISAVQSWSRYRARIRNVVDRRGKGSNTYSWAAWESRWAEVMSQLIFRAKIPAFQQPQSFLDPSEEHTSWQVYAATEKTMSAVERMLPHQNLHHPGYWLRLAARSVRVRRQRAMDIPEEDRVPPGQSPASTVVKRTKSYDFYLALEPHEESPLSASSGHDHTAECTDLTKKAVDQFDKRSQARFGDVLRLDLAGDFVAAERYQDAIQILRPLLENNKWRIEGWNGTLRRLLSITLQCARQTDAADVFLGAMYELISLGSFREDDPALDMSKALEALSGPSDVPIKLEFEDRQRLCPVAVSFAFESKETSVGESFGCQLTLLSRFDASSAPLSLSEITLSFDNSQVVLIRHDAEQGNLYLRPSEDSGASTLQLKANLTLRPNDRRVFHFSLTFKEAKAVRLETVAMAIKEDAFAITHTLKDETLFRANAFLIDTETGPIRKDVAEAESTIIHVAPKPPKVEILIQSHKKRYYTDETIRLSVSVVNGEDEAIDGKVEAHATDDEASSETKMHWEKAGDATTASVHVEDPTPAESPSTLSMPSLTPNASHEASLTIQAPPNPRKMAVEIAVEYTVLSDDSTAIRKTAVAEVDVSAPFEPTSSFGPVLYPETWPTYFQSPDGPSAESPEGIPQLWCLNMQLQSMANDRLHLHHAELEIDRVGGDSVARVRMHHEDKSVIMPKDHRECLFELYTQKHSLDDRRPTSLESTLEVTWSREADAPPVTTRLALPRLTIPVSEPRVLCTRNVEKTDDGRYTLCYHIENPSTHFLTFALTMEASEDFAFSGPKYQSLSLAPLSRYRVEYQVLPQDGDGADSAGERWIWPGMQVVDSYYQKTLRVLPGGPHVKMDERQRIGVSVQ